MVDREQVRLQRRLPVHVEEHSPELARRHGPVGDRLDHIDVTGRRAALELRMDPVQRVAGRLAVELEHERVLLSPALASLRRIGEVARLPPRIRAPEHAGRAEAGAVVDRREDVLRLLQRGDAHRCAVVARLPQGGVAARQRHLAGQRGEAVAVPAVDDLLRGPEGGDRLAALTDVLELRAHHRREDPATAVGREHADDRHPAAVDRAARHRQLERERAGTADDPVAVERGVHPLKGQVAGEPLRRLVVGRPTAEVVADRADRTLELVEVAGRADLPGH